MFISIKTTHVIIPQTQHSINRARAGGSNSATACMTLPCSTTQPPSTSKFTACQGHFVMWCVDAAGRECPSPPLSPSLSLSVFCIWQLDFLCVYCSIKLSSLRHHFAVLTECIERLTHFLFILDHFVAFIRPLRARRSTSLWEKNQQMSISVTASEV